MISVLKELQEKYDKVAEECRRFKKQCRILAKRLKDAGCKYENYVYRKKIFRNSCVIGITLNIINLCLNAIKDEGEERSYMKGTGECVVFNRRYHNHHV